MPIRVLPYRSNGHGAAKALLIELHKKIRENLPDITETFALDRVSISEIKEGFMDKKSIKRVIVILRGSGCAWAVADRGGCFMCGHITGTLRGGMISAENYCTQFDQEIARYDFTKYPMLCVYNGGSFLNAKEIPLSARRHILERIRKQEGIKRLVIESRPEFITDGTIAELEKILDGMDVEIGVGLESSDETVNDLCVNKGFTVNQFVEVAKRLKKSKIKLLAYILLKPPFLTESEAVKDACRSIEFAFNAGAEIVSLEPVSLQDFTLTNFLYEAGHFRSPWIWSVIEVIRRTHKFGLVRLGGFEFFPIPKIFTHNCEQCNEMMIRSIQRFNSTYDIHSFDDLDCECKREWELEMEQTGEVLPRRILRLLRDIDDQEIIDRMRMNFDLRGLEQTNTLELLFKSWNTSSLRDSRGEPQ